MRPIDLRLAGCSLLAATVWAAAAPAQGVSLEDLPDLARARSERQRPAQEAALEPFWADLRLDYGANRKYLDEQLPKVVALGDSVVPLLLEKLRPADDSGESRELAANCARVLRSMEPASFLDALLANLDGASKTARVHSIWLLGFTRSQRAARALREGFGSFDSTARREAAAALGALGDRAASTQVVTLLQSADRKDRRAALDYLVAVAPAEVIPQALAVMKVEQDPSLLPLFVEYLGKCGQRDAATAEALLPLLDGDRLDQRDTLELVRILGKVAPEGHTATLARLGEILAGQTGQRGRTAALAMLALGDKKGVNTLKDEIDEAIRKRSRESDLWMQRAELYFSLENWRAALTDFERAQRLGGRRTKRLALLRMASCEAHLDRWPRVLKHLRDSNANAQEIREAAAADPALKEALEKESIRRWFNGLSG